MSIASTFIKGAETVLRIGGSTGTLSKVTKGAYDPVTGETAENVETFSVQVSNPSHVERWENGSLVRMGEDSMVMGIKGLTVIPEVGDRIQINSASWTLTNVKEVQAQNTTVIYKCLIKK